MIREVAIEGITGTSQVSPYKTRNCIYTNSKYAKS